MVNPVFLARNRMLARVVAKQVKQQKSKTNLLMEKKSSKEYSVVFLVEGKKFNFNLGEKNSAIKFRRKVQICLVGRQISIKLGVSTARYDKSIKLGTFILDIVGNIFKIRGNRHMLRVSQERVVNVLGVIIQNGRRQRYFFGVETYSIIV